MFRLFAAVLAIGIVLGIGNEMVQGTSLPLGTGAANNGASTADAPTAPAPAAQTN